MAINQINPVPLRNEISLALATFGRIQSGFDFKKNGNFGNFERWVEHQVAPIVDGFLKRSDFRELVRWEIDQLRSSSQSPMRKIILEIDKFLTRTACDLAAFGLRPEIQETIPPAVVQGLQLLGDRPWTDLVNPEDFFGPRGGLNLKAPTAWPGRESKAGPLGDLLPYLNPEFQRLGHFLLQACKIRMDYWWGALMKVQETLINLLNEKNPGLKPLKEAGFKSKSEFHGLLQQLDHLYQAEPSRSESNAAVVLVQAAAAFRSGMKLDLPGIAWKNKREIQLRIRLPQAKRAMVFDNVATAMLRLVDFWKVAPSPEADFKESSRSHLLVVVDKPGDRRIYWKEKEILEDWRQWNREWDLWMLLVKRAEFEGIVEARDLGARSLKSIKYRLCKHFPDSLSDAICSLGNGAYKLKVSNGQIKIFSPK